MEYYRQCRLQKSIGDETYLEQTSYIPEPFCAKDKVLKLMDDAGHWSNGWVVVAVDGGRIPAANLPDLHKAVRGHRSNTGDDLPKLTAQGRKR
jgi:hypothetical protein